MFVQQDDHHPNPLRVLVVEDNDDDAELLVAALRADGLTIDVQRVDTEAAFHEALSWDPHLILTDYRLPGFNALSVIQMARERSPSPPVVLVSGAIGEDLATEAIKQGAVDFLFKDRLGRLGAAVRTAISGRALTADRIRLEAAFNRERGLLGSVLDSVPDAIYVKDMALRFQRLNGATALELGLTSPDEAIGRSDTDFFPATQAAEYAADERRLLTTGEPVVSKLQRRLVGDEQRWVLATKVPLRDPAGTVIGLVGINRDVTERTRLEEDLRASEKKFRSLIDQLPAVVYVLAGDERRTTSYFSPRMKDLTGYTPQEVIDWRMQSPWLESVHPEDRVRVGVEAARAVTAGEPFRAEYRHARKDGSYVWILDEGVPVHDESGHVIAWHGVLLDISERVQAEEGQAHLAAIVESAEDGILSTTLDGTITSWNYGAEKLYGYRIDEAIGRNSEMLRPPELADDIADLIAGVRHGISVEGHETVRLTRDGRRVRVSLSISPIRDANGSIIGIASISRDITALRKVEDALRESEARFRGVWENTRDAISLSDPAGIVLAANPAYAELYGFPPEITIGLPFSIIFPEPDRARADASYHALFADPSPPPSSVEATIQRADGVIREVESRVSFIEIDGRREGLVSAIRDVTERKQLEHDLRLALDAANAATRSKSQFLAMMSHELRTPLQAVLGYTDFLLLGAEDTLVPEQREDLGHIHRGGIRMLALIEQLLDLSRLEAGRMDLMQELVDLQEIIDQVRPDIAPQAMAKGLELSITLPAALPLVLGDAGRLRQVLLNLADNAIKFTDQGAVSISAHSSGNSVSVAVRDTGIGITAEALPMVFEEFRQVDSSMTRRYGGAGLGLAIAKRLVEQMGGSITVESQPDHGSTFTVHLRADPQNRSRRSGRHLGDGAEVMA